MVNWSQWTHIRLPFDRKKSQSYPKVIASSGNRYRTGKHIVDIHATPVTKIGNGSTASQSSFTRYKSSTLYIWTAQPISVCLLTLLLHYLNAWIVSNDADNIRWTQTLNYIAFIERNALPSAARVEVRCGE